MIKIHPSGMFQLQSAITQVFNFMSTGSDRGPNADPTRYFLSVGGQRLDTRLYPQENRMEMRIPTGCRFGTIGRDEDFVLLNVEGIQFAESGSCVSFEKVVFNISPDPTTAGFYEAVIHTLFGFSSLRPQTINVRGMQLPLCGSESDKNSWGVTRTSEFFVGLVSIAADGSVTAGKQKVRKLDHTKNRQMLNKIREFTNQALIRARLQVATVESVVDAYRKRYGGKHTPSEVANDVLKDALLEFLETEELAPDLINDLFLAVITEQGYGYALREMSSLGPDLSKYREKWQYKRVHEIISDHVMFKRILDRIHNRIKEHIRQATGVVTFEDPE